MKTAFNQTQATKDPVPNLNLVILIPMLAAIIAISPLAIDLYLPAMATIAASFHTDITMVQQSLSIYLAGYALGMLCFGPLADRVGRRPLVLLGLTGFGLMSLLLAFVTSIESFLALTSALPRLSSSRVTSRRYMGKTRLRVCLMSALS